jgi:uncharacterized protein YecT (DUF1311 family)
MRALLLLLALGGPALAQEPNCAAPQTQADMTQCAGIAYRMADEDLNLAYQMTLKTFADFAAADPELGEGGVEAVRQAQRAWIAYRDAACTAEAWSYRGGSMEPMVLANCLERLTRARTEDLRLIGETN